jgi:hypothetical protein
LGNSHVLPRYESDGIGTRLFYTIIACPRPASIDRTVKEIPMGIIIANTAGILTFILGMGFVAVSNTYFNVHIGHACLMMGVGWVLVDGLLRLRHRKHPRWYIHPEFGGHMFYIPLWILGAVTIVAMIYGLATDPPGWFTSLPTTTGTAF